MLNSSRMIVLGLMVIFLAGCRKASTTTEPPSQTPTESAKTDEERLQGKWEFLKVEVPEGASRKVDGQDLDTFLKSVEIEVDDRVIRGKINKITMTGTFRLDSTKSPKQIDITETDAKGEPTRHPTTKEIEPIELAIYKFDGETLVIAAQQRRGGPNRPTGFIPVKKNEKAGKIDEFSAVIVFYLKKKN
jgi:uncharacterized protein (TIGR03067 family)